MPQVFGILRHKLEPRVYHNVEEYLSFHRSAVAGQNLVNTANLLIGHFALPIASLVHIHKESMLLEGVLWMVRLVFPLVPPETNREELIC